MLQQLIVPVVQVCFGLLADSIRNAPVGGAQTALPPAPAPPGPPGATGCPACRAHRESVEARGLLEGMARKADWQGAVPRHVAGTIRLARACLEVAEVKVAAVAERRPELGPQAELAQQALAQAKDALPARDELEAPGGGARASQAAVLVGDAWWYTYEVAVAYFAPLPDDDPAKQEFLAQAA